MAGDTSGVLELATNGSTTAITIDTSQNVGIGTTSPNCRAHFQGGTNSDGSLTFNNQLTSEAAYNTPPSVGTLVSLKYNSSGSYAGMGGWSIGKENATDGNFASYLALHTRPNGGSTTERMRIDSSGNVLFGTTSSVSSLADGNASTNGMGYRNNSTGCWLAFQNESAACFYASKKTGYTDARFMQFSVNATGVGSITTNGTTTSYVTTSDYRLKENIVPMTGALDKIAQLKPVTYKWKIDGSDGQGFIAHELQEVVSDCVSGEKDAVETYTDEDGNEQTRIKPQGIDTSFLVATLTAAIQEQQTIINDLKARVTALEAK
jgi:hypothetical protein